MKRPAGWLPSLFVCAILCAAAWGQAQTITIAISSDPAGASLSGSGTRATSLSLGTVSRIGGAQPIGVTRSTTASDWTLSTPFDVTVTKDVLLVLSTSYTLQANIATSDAVKVWSVDAIPLTTTPASMSITGSYATVTQHSLAVKIPNNAPPGAFSNTITLTAISN